MDRTRMLLFTSVCWPVNEKHASSSLLETVATSCSVKLTLSGKLGVHKRLTRLVSGVMLRVVVLEQILEQRGDVLAQGVVSAVVQRNRRQRVPRIPVIAPFLG